MAFYGKFVDMAKSPGEVKSELADSPQATPCPPSNPKVPVYPYGLCISITEEEMPKLGIDELPEVDDMIHIMAMAKVTSVSDREETDGSGNKTRHCRIELQITHLATEDESTEEPAARQGRFYGEEKSEAA